MQSPARAHAFVVAEVVMAMAVVAILATALTVTVAKQQRAMARLDQSRAAMRFAEAALLSLQTSRPSPPPRAGMSLHVIAVANSEAPVGCAWATIHVDGNGPSAELTGLVRADALKGANP